MFIRWLKRKAYEVERENRKYQKPLSIIEQSILTILSLGGLIFLLMHARYSR